MSKKNGGPAFPQTCADALDVGMVHAGMSLRDYYAGQALPSSLIRFLAEANKEALLNAVPICAAEMAYEVADAMMKVRTSG